MRRKFVVLLVLVTFTTVTLGCSITIHDRVRVEKEELVDALQADPVLDGTIIEAVYLSGDVIEFEEPGARYSPSTAMVRGRTTGGREVEIAVDDIAYFLVERKNQGKSTAVTILVVVGITAIVVGVLVAAAAAGFENADSY